MHSFLSFVSFVVNQRAGLMSVRTCIIVTPVNRTRLFQASCIALGATAMSFAIRGDIMGDVQQLLRLDDVRVGWILGAAFWGFGLSILVGGPLCDVLGMGTIIRLAALGHIGGALLTVL